MKRLERLILLAGLAALAALLWRMDLAELGAQLRQVGWGFAFLLPQELAAHVFNALGWRFSYRSEQARHFGLSQLLRLRIAGDGINYLTPSGTLAGEFARTAALDDSVPATVRGAGVVVAKCAQACAQLLFVLLGLATVLKGRVALLRPYEGLIQALAVLGVAALLLAAFAGRGKPKPAAAAPGSGLRGLLSQLKRYFLDHPGRCALSIFFFLCGWAWGAFEAYWICLFIGLPVPVAAAFAIETLSILIDGVFFMVPAKVGTQEAGKTAIFALLGLSPQAGLAFGVVRHIRELAWAGAGMLLYSGVAGRGGRKVRPTLKTVDIRENAQAA